MKISVIVPIYNIEKRYLAKCFESLISGNEGTAMEIIAVDDGSTNGCGKVALYYSGKYDFVRLIRQENQGTSVARNTGLDAAKGEYVMFVDGDDWVSSGSVKRILEEMEKSPVDVLFFGYATNYRNREVPRILEKAVPELMKREILERSVLEGNPAFGPVEVGTPWGKLIRRDILERHKIRYKKGLKKGQDTVFMLHLLEHSETFAYFPYLGYHYRVSENSVSRRFQRDIVNTMEGMLDSYGEFARSYGKDEAFFSAIRRKYCKVLLGEYLELWCLSKENPKPLSERISDFRAVAGKEPYKSVLLEVDVPLFCSKANLKDNENRGGMSMLWRLELLLLKKDLIVPLFLLKKLEMGLKDLVAQKYS